MPRIFDKDNTEHTAEVERCVKAAKAQTPPITECAALLAEVLKNSSIDFRTDTPKNKRKVSRYIQENFCTAADIAPRIPDSWHKYATPASPLDELIVPVLLAGTMIVIAYYSCMKAGIRYGVKVRDRGSIGFAPAAMKGKTDEEKDKAARDAALFETLVALLMHPDHQGQQKFIKDLKLRTRVMAEVKKRLAAKGVVAPMMGGAGKNIGPGMALSRDRKTISVRWFVDGVRQPDATFDYNTAGRIAAAEFVLKNCGHAVRLAQLEENRKAFENGVPLHLLPHKIGQAAVDAREGKALTLPLWLVESSDEESDEEMLGAPDDADEEERGARPRRRARAKPADGTDVSDDDAAHARQPKRARAAPDVVSLTRAEVRDLLKLVPTPRRGATDSSDSDDDSDEGSVSARDAGAADAASPLRRVVDHEDLPPSLRVDPSWRRDGDASDEDDDSDDDWAVSLGPPLVFHPAYVALVRAVDARSRRDDEPGEYCRATRDAAPLCEKLERLHVDTLGDYGIPFARNWQFFWPCRTSQLLGMAHVDKRLYGYWQEGLRLPRDRWLDHINDRFWADRALACQVLRREYGIADDVELPELLFGELRGLWVVAAMYNAVELPFCALVLRPRSLDCRWFSHGAVLDPYEVKRYYGHKRFKVVTESVAYAEGIRKVKEQAGVLGL